MLRTIIAKKPFYAKMQHMMRNKNIIVGVGIVLLLMGGGTYIFLDLKDGDSVLEKNEVPGAGLENPTNPPPPAPPGQNYKIDIEPISATPPTLDRKVVIKRPDATTADNKRLEDKIVELIGTVKKEPTNYATLIDLGTYWRTAGDYDAARQVWEHATRVFPTDSVAYSNLGVLYAQDLKDNTKAGQYFLKAIAQDPTYGYSYVQLADFYHNVLRDNTKAREILERGIKANSAFAPEFNSLIKAYSE